MPEPSRPALVFHFLASSYMCWLQLFHYIRLYMFPAFSGLFPSPSHVLLLLIP